MSLVIPPDGLWWSLIRLSCHFHEASAFLVLKYCHHSRHAFFPLTNPQRYKPDEDRFVVKGHEDDKEFQKAFWSKMLKSLCDPGCV